jgi:hypothetical protein
VLDYAEVVTKAEFDKALRLVWMFETNHALLAFANSS